jgi:hypothetical protein
MNRRSVAPVWAALVALAIPIFSQTGKQNKPTATIHIELLGHTAGFFGRYVLESSSTKSSINKRTGWISPAEGAQSVEIAQVPAGRPAHLKAILYAPGCQIKTLDLAVTESRAYEYSFQCKALPEIEITGRLIRLDRLYGYKVRIEAKYVADWAPAFFKYRDGTVTAIPLGGAAFLDSENSFRLPVPDFSKDEIVGSRDRAGELEIWARDQASGRLIAQLRLLPTNRAAKPTRLGGIPVGTNDVSDLEFSPCAANPPEARDRFGFAMRPDAEDACDSL